MTCNSSILLHLNQMCSLTRTKVEIAAVSLEAQSREDRSNHNWQKKAPSEKPASEVLHPLLLSGMAGILDQEQE